MHALFCILAMLLNALAALRLNSPARAKKPDASPCSQDNLKLTGRNRFSKRLARLLLLRAPFGTIARTFYILKYHCLSISEGRASLNNESSTENLAETILQIAAQQKPETVNQLVELVRQAYYAQNREALDVRQGYDAQNKAILDTILQLQEQGKLQLTPRPQQTLATSAYLKTSAALWFWTTLALTFATLVTVFTIPETSYPLVYIRYVLGTIFVLWLPGYAFMKALFPEQLPIKTSEKDLDIIERTALSIGMSLALVPIVGLLLNYTPWGIRLTPIVLSLVTLTAVFAFAAVLREHQISISKKA
jgi:hypothetical protein